ncbi:MAG: hypothetical protein NTZ90_09725 [Proteobacteria bacterium]|nr:hypothetical protein [Pseudomonadota bacterium]
MLIRDKKMPRHVAYALAALLVTVGCGRAPLSANKTDSSSPSARGNQTANAAATDGSGGSLHLTQPDSATSANVTQIEVTLDNASPTCASGQEKGNGKGKGHRPGHGSDGDRDDRGGPRGWQRGPGPGFPPPGPFLPPGAKPGDAGIAVATNGSGSLAGAPGMAPAAPAPARVHCAPIRSKQPFVSGQALTMNSIPAGDYLLTVLLEDANSNAIESGNVKVTIAAGQVASAAVTLAPVAQTASGNGGVSVSVTQAVGAASKLAVTSDALSEVIGSCGAVIVSTEDSNGNASAWSGALTLNLTSSAATGAFYSDQACTAAITSLSFAAAAQSGTVYYKDSAAGTPSLTFTDANANGLGAVSATATIAAQ